MAKRRRRSQADPSRVVGYVRTSTEEQSLGSEAQRAALERWCEAEGATLVAVHCDLGVSGAAPIEKREGLTAAIDALAEHRGGTFLAMKRDRLARDIVAAGMIERLVERAGARVRTTDGTGDGDGPEAALMRGIVDLFAQFERGLIRARTRSALAVKRSRGERVGSIPYGKRLAADGRHLEPEPTEQRAVALARELRAEGLTFAAVGRRLAADGLRPRSGQDWHTQTLRRIVGADSAPSAR